jgi:hypothetical protein
MPKPIKNTQKTIVKAAHLAVWTALLLAGCGNDFINEVISELKPSPSVPSSTPTIGWSSDTILIEPVTGLLSGTIYGNINAFGNDVLFDSKELSNPSKDPNAPGGRFEKWELKPLTSKASELLPASTMGAFLVGGTPAISGSDTIITLIFGSQVALENFPPGVFASDGENYSFILHPDAFRGKDAGKLTTKATTLNFRVDAPTKTNYAKYLIEKANYGTISVSWAEGSSKSPDDPRVGMKYCAAELAASAATNIFSGYGSLTAENFPSSGATSFSAGNVVWVSPPDLSRGYWNGKSTLQLEPILGTIGASDTQAVPSISVQVNFTSKVGEAGILIKEAENAGSFATVGGNTDAIRTGVENILTSLNITNYVNGSEVRVVKNGVVQIVLGDGVDTSPGATFEITLW